MGACNCVFCIESLQLILYQNYVSHFQFLSDYELFLFSALWKLLSFFRLLGPEGSNVPKAHSGHIFTCTLFYALVLLYIELKYTAVQ